MRSQKPPAFELAVENRATASCFNFGFIYCIIVFKGGGDIWNRKNRCSRCASGTA